MSGWSGGWAADGGRRWATVGDGWTTDERRMRAGWAGGWTTDERRMATDERRVSGMGRDGGAGWKMAVPVSSATNGLGLWSVLRLSLCSYGCKFTF